MKAPLAALLLGSSLLLVAPATRAQDHAVLAEPLSEMLAKLQGTWSGTEKGREGKCQLTVKGSALHFEGADKREWYKAIALVNTNVEPAQLSGRITDCPEPTMVGKTALAVIKIEGGTLTLTGHQPGAAEAPKTLEGDAQSRTFVFHKAE